MAPTCLYGVVSALSVKELYIGRAAASYWLSGDRPRINSIVWTMLTVLYCVPSTNFRLVYGLMTRPTVRCASTWSGPFWASSSITKMAVSFQYLPLDTASTSRPSARSLLAMQHWGVYDPVFVPSVWSSPRLITMNRGILSSLANCSYSLRNTSTLSVSRGRTPLTLPMP